MDNASGHRGSTAAGDRGHAAGTSSQTPTGSFEHHAAIQLLTAHGPLTHAALTGLHQGLIDRRLVIKVLEARRAGARLATGLETRGRNLRQLVADGGFDWGPAGAAHGAGADGHAKGGTAGAAAAAAPGAGAAATGAHGVAATPALGEAAAKNGAGALPGASGDGQAGAGGGAEDLAQFPLEAEPPEPTEPTEPAPREAPAAPAAAASGGDAARDASAEAAPAGGRQPAVVARRASGGDAIQAQQASATLDRAAERSASSPLEGGVQRQMEASFGQPFADVRVHTDAPAAEAASDLHAHAFTVGRDVYFGAGAYDPGGAAGQHLIAHELAHVAQGASGAARATGEGVTVSEPGDAGEIAADRAADRAVAGEAVGTVGAAPASLVHRDAISDLDRAAQGSGSWVGHVDQNDLLARFRRLGPADRQSLFMDASRRDLMSRIVRGATASTMLFMFNEVNIAFVWKVYWLTQGNHLGDLDGAGWRFLLGYASRADMDALRAYPDGFRSFLAHAPPELVPPWDLIQGLASGAVHPSAEAVRNAVNRLDPQQKETLRDRASIDKVRAIITHAGSSDEQFRTCTYLGFELNWSLYWLNQVGRLGSLSAAQWGKVLSEAGQTQWNALITWPEMWRRVQAECPADVLQIVQARYNSTPAGTTSTTQAWDDLAQVGRMFDVLGGAGFLAQATSDEAQVAHRYARTKEAGKVMPVLEHLLGGAQMGEAARRNLALWWNRSGETNLEIMKKMFEVRFRVQLSSTWWQRRTQNDADTDLSEWNLEGLQHCWTVCERLPPAQVEGNNRLLYILRNSRGANGNAYYSPSGDNVVMGQQRGAGGADERLTDTTDSTAHVYTAGGQGTNADGTRSTAATVNKFNATLRHEIGHAVDAQLNVMEGGWRNQTVAGGWQKYGSWSGFVDALINDFGGLTAANGVPAGQQNLFRNALLRTVRAAGGKTFRQALTEEDASTASLPDTQIDKGPMSAVWVGQRWTDVSDGPWYHPEVQPTSASGRSYQSAYKNDDSLWSYVRATRNGREVTRYQWRAPGEWFAECYQVYYSEQEDGANVPVGGRLRARDPEAATMMTNLVDRGYSPQDLRGDRSHTGASTGTQPPPGATRRGGP